MEVGTNKPTTVLDIEQVELKGFAKSITEIEWLLLLLVTLYYVAPGTDIEDPFGLHMSLIGFGIFVMGFNYINAEAPYSTYKLLLKTGVMLAFITWAVWNTGSIDSPLVNLYILVIISSAITLGKVITFIEIAIIALFYLVFSHNQRLDFSFAGFSELLIYFAPFILVAYITSMLVADIHYGRRMFKALSEIDEMTSLLNKRSFSPLLNKAAELAVKYSHPLSVMMIDADNLKQVNDNLGHKAGDELIRHTAGTIQDCLRASDITCRYGGDELVVLLPKVTADKALETAERVRRAVEKMSFEVDGGVVTSTVSIGVATYPSDVADVTTLMETADKALYLSKKAGRNRAMSYAMAGQDESVGSDRHSQHRH